MKPFLSIPSWDGKVSVETFRSIAGFIRTSALDEASLMVQGLDVVRMRNMAASIAVVSLQVCVIASM